MNEKSKYNKISGYYKLIDSNHIKFSNDLEMFAEYLNKSQKITEFFYNHAANLKPFDISVFSKKGISLDRKA